MDNNKIEKVVIPNFIVAVHKAVKKDNVIKHYYYLKITTHFNSGKSYKNVVFITENDFNNIK